MTKTYKVIVTFIVHADSKADAMDKVVWAIASPKTLREHGAKLEDIDAIEQK